MKAQECSDGEEGNYSPVLEHGREAEAVDIEQDEREQKRRRTELLAAEKVKQVGCAAPLSTVVHSFMLFFFGIWLD